MQNAPVYLDYNATVPVRPEVIEAAGSAMAAGGNPSSVHAAGRAARERVERAREAVAALIGTAPRRIVFTGSGSEANALALGGAGRDRVLVSAVEHPSVLRAVSGAETIPVSADGLVEISALERRLDGVDAPALVSVMAANNETGVLQPLEDVVALAHRHGALVHVDAVQALGRVALDFTTLGADLMSLSAHKIGGPQGVGALVVADSVPLHALIRGGGQEGGRRAGTENVAGIVGFGVAAQAAARDRADQPRIAALRDRLEARALAAVATARVYGRATARLPNTSCLGVPGLSNALQVMTLDLAGIAVSAGAACSSGKVASSHVLRAMGLDESEAGSAIRVSLGWASRGEDIDRFLAVWCELAARSGARHDPRAA